MRKGRLLVRAIQFQKESFQWRMRGMSVIPATLPAEDRVAWSTRIAVDRVELNVRRVCYRAR